MNRCFPSLSDRGLMAGRKRRACKGARCCLLVFAAVLLMVGGHRWAASAQAADPVTGAAVIQSLPRGEAFENGGQPYVWLPTLRAEVPGPGRSATDAEGGEVVGRKGRFAIYGPPAAGGDLRAPLAEPAPAPVHPVVLNRYTGALGVLTRNLWITLPVMADAEVIAADYGLDFSFANAAMKTAFYAAPESIEMKGLRERLAADPRVGEVTLEILDRIRRPR